MTGAAMLDTLPTETFADHTAFKTGKPIIFGFSGHIGAGKSYAADYLVSKYGFELRKMAGPLKTMLRSVGLTDAHIEGHLKELPCDMLCGQTPRWAMQTLGTEWGRDIIGEDLWANLWRHSVEGLDRVVVDDVRFANEAAAVRSLGGRVVFVERNDGAMIRKSTHASENFDFEPDERLLNGGGAGFEAVLDRMVRSALDG